MIIHCGSGHGDGHYIMYIHTADRGWYCYDDKGSERLRRKAFGGETWKRHFGSGRVGRGGVAYVLGYEREDITDPMLISDTFPIDMDSENASENENSVFVGSGIEIDELVANAPLVRPQNRRRRRRSMLTQSETNVKS